MRISDWSSDVCSSDLLDHDSCIADVKCSHQFRDMEGKRRGRNPQTATDLLAGYSLRKIMKNGHLPRQKRPWVAADTGQFVLYGTRQIDFAGQGRVARRQYLFLSVRRAQEDRKSTRLNSSH